jgi:hypothetical protein
MKTSAVLASLLFGSFAVAAPVDKRALVYKTETVVETVVVYTTVYDDEPVAQATTPSDGAFYQKPKTTTSSVVVKPTSSAAPVSSAASVSSAAPTSSSVVPAYTPVEPVKSSSIYTPPAQPSTSTSTSTPTPTPSPAPAPETSSAAAPAPTTTEPAYTPAPTTTEPAYTPAPVSSAAPAPTGGSSTGEQFTGVDMTIYDNAGGYGACGKPIYDGDMIVALAKDAWGVSTYDTMTGDATNPWCGQKIKIDYNGNSIEATIMDLCPGCSGHDIDLSLAAWTKLTGLAEKTRLKASWSKIS